MNILILGAGQVGSTLAANFSSEDENNVTIVDISSDQLKPLQDKYDLRTVQGLASYPQILEQAGGANADLVIAVTKNDEVNILSLQVAHKLFKNKTKIARIRSHEYLESEHIFRTNSAKEKVIDVFISPDKLVTDYILRLLEHPGALQVMDFAEGRLRLVAVKAFYGGPLVGHEIRDLKSHLPNNAETRIVAIFRNGQSIAPEGSTILEVGDEVFFLAERENIKMVMSELRRLDKAYKRVMIAGGGNIGYRLAKELESRCSVKLIEHGEKRARSISELLDDTLVLHGDATDQELLKQEGIQDVDVFLALTNSDEANLISSMLAKKHGARKVMSIVNKTTYVDLVQNDAIDIAISPEQITISGVLAYAREGDTETAYSLRRGAAEVMELVVHGHARESQVVDRMISEIPLPVGVTIGAVLREDEVIIVHHDTVVHDNDHVVLFFSDKSQIPYIEKLFGGV